MTRIDKRFYPFQQRMLDVGLPDLFIEIFSYYYHQLLAGRTGLISEKDIEPVESMANMLELPDRLQDIGEQASQQIVLIKLNGGLGTSMGLQKAKSLLVVKNGYTFLDIIARQAIYSQVPLVLMNSFVTEADSLRVLDAYEELIDDIPQTFVQHMEPKVRQSDYLPAECPKDPDLTWCPPGHGDIYTAMVTKGVLMELLEAGFKYAFVSNADNLGATIDFSLLGYFVENRLPFMLEVAERTEIDRKGGHLARRKKDGRLILRESAQCPDDETAIFQDISHYSYFNTNNLWINLDALEKMLKQQNFNLGLPMIRNSKTVNPIDRTSTPVYQLETAMGTAVEVFENAEAVLVPRSRFAPVKKTSDLLVVRSDVYQLSDDFTLRMHPSREGKAPLVDLDPRYYQFIDEFDARFSYGVPSLLMCDSLSIEGDFCFGGEVEIRGDVKLSNGSKTQRFIADGSVLDT